jgi:lactoylglutathione lyase
MSARINMIGLFPENLTNMVAFYRDILGFAIEWDGQGPYAEFQNDGVRFAMYERKLLPGLMGQTPEFTSGINGTFEIAIDFPTCADLDHEFARITSSGARIVYPPRDEPWGMRSSMILDPEGNLIELSSWEKNS